MKQLRLWTGPDGASHFEEYEIELKVTEFVPGFPSEITAPSAAHSIHFTRLPVGAFQSWHTSPHPHCAITLSGEVEIAASDGERRRFGPGELYFEHDATGRGHQTRVVGEQDWVAAVVSLAQ